MRQHGFSLLEVLITLIIVSIGLLGLAGLTTASLKNNQSAYQRSIASWQAYDILDRMRANRTIANGGGYNVALGVAPAAANPIAQTDLTQWKQQLAASLPSGDGSVTTNGGISSIVVRWNDSRGLGTLNGSGYVGNSVQSFTINTQL
ncbi:MAG: type IV pilus modification protein PilV [Thiobacillaceae bacterium]